MLSNLNEISIEYNDRFRTLVHLMDSIVQIYLQILIQPSITAFDSIYVRVDSMIQNRIVAIYHKLNRLIPTIIESSSRSTAIRTVKSNTLFYFRIIMVVPILVLISRGHQFFPSFIILLLLFCDFAHNKNQVYSKDNCCELEHPHIDHKYSDIKEVQQSDKDTFGT
jgi:hypothetical protein